MTRVERECAARVLERINYMQCTGDPTIDEQKRAVDTAIAALREPEWVRAADRLPDGNEHDEVVGLYKGLDYLMYDIVQIGWLRLHPEMYVFWMRLPEKPEVKG